MDEEKVSSEGWQSGSTRFSGYALFDEVRLRYFKRFENSLDLLEANQKYISQGYLPRYLWEFISTVCSLYVELEPKLDYGKDRDLVVALGKIKRLMQTGQYELDNSKLKSLGKIEDIDQQKSLAIYFDFVAYFFQMRRFIELNGITKYEQAEHDLAEMIMRGLKAKG